MTDRPTNQQEFLALPEGGGFSVRIGGNVRIPVAPDVVAFYSAPDDIISCADDDGQIWMLGRYADGRWFRRSIV